jgi:hypothetical protein
MSKKTFGTKLKNLNNVIELIIANQYNVGTTNVDNLIDLTQQYTSLSNGFNNYTLNEEQTRALKAVRDQYPRETRSAVNRKIKGIIEERERQTQKVEAEVERRKQKSTEAKDIVRTLFPQTRKAAEKCLKANTSTLDNLIKVYKSLSASLRQAIDSLKSEERLEQIQELTALSQLVNQYKAKMDEQDRQNLKAIQAAVSQARKKVSQMTVGDLLLSLLGSNGTQNLLGSIDKDSLKLLQNRNVEADAGSLVLTDLSKPEQNILVRVLMNELTKVSSSSQSTALAQFIKAMEKDLDALMTGKKTHLSILYEDKGIVGSVHVDILDLVKNPAGTLEAIFYGLYKNGLSVNTGVVMTLTSPTEVNALLQLDNLKLSSAPQLGNLQELTGQVIKYAANPQALAQIVGGEAEVSFIQKKLAQASNRRGLEASEVLGFIEAMATLLETKRILVSTPTKGKELGVLTNIKDGGVKGTIEYVHIPSTPNDSTLLSTIVSEYTLPEEGIPESKKTDEFDAIVEKENIRESDTRFNEEKKQRSKKPAHQKIDLSNEYQQFYASLRELANIYEKLSEKGKYGNKKYQNTAEQVLSVYVGIKDAGESFFSKPNSSTLINFSDVTIAQINSIDTVLQEHRGNQFGRGLVAVLNGLLGIIAALTVLPALIVEVSTNKGYAGTFFSAPQPESAKAFQSVKKGLIEQGLNIETKVIGPCTPGR